jgi:hypothetical protein
MEENLNLFGIITCYLDVLVVFGIRTQILPITLSINYSLELIMSTLGLILLHRCNSLIIYPIIKDQLILCY